MASGTIALTVNSSGYYSQLTGYISWQETSVNQDENKSTVSATMTFVRPSDGEAQSGWGSSAFWIEIDGTRTNYTGSFYISSGQTVTVNFTATKTISHNANGSKSITISAGGYAGDYSGRVTAIQGSSGSGTAVLADIPRESTIGTISGNTMGSNVRTNIVRSANSAFYHKLTWSFGSASGTVNSVSTSATYIDWTPSTATLAAQVTNATSGTCTLTLTTYSNSSLTTQVGTPSTKTFTLQVPTSVVPTVSSIAITETFSTNNTGVFLASISKPKFTATASGVYGSTIVNYSFTFSGQTKSGSATNQTFDPTLESGSITVYCTVTDSRGRTGTLSQSFTFLPYTAPTLSSATVLRDDTTPTTVKVALVANVQSIEVSGVEKNTMTCYALYTTSSGTYPSPSNAYKITTSGISTGGTSTSDGQKEYTNISDARSYKFKIVVKDKFFEVSQDFRLSTAAVIMDITDQGYIGINKRWERGALDINGRMYIGNGNLYVGAGKTGLYDGNPGSSLGQIALTLQGSPALASGGNYPNIRFFGNTGSTAATIGMYEYADGHLTIEDKTNLFKHSSPRSSGGEVSAYQLLPELDHTDVGWSGANGFPDGYLQAWISHVCNNYVAGGDNTMFIASARSGSRGMIFFFVYSFNALTNNLPQHSMGLLIPYSQSSAIKRFGTANYTFWSADI